MKDRFAIGELQCSQSGPVFRMAQFTGLLADPVTARSTTAIPWLTGSVSERDTSHLTVVSSYDTCPSMIKSFRDRTTEAVFNDEIPKGFQQEIAKVARRKLGFLNAAVILDDLRAPPGNRLEALKGDRSGQHSIRINDQFRICFEWTDEGPKNVEITDYH